ncbi:hypothetical protein [Dyadobacter sp. LHD-138]|uniref:hypothetical protein n=1 Tax=Dyadobacter sp. LHD-138 TaxID=3071413 RepID=UPI0027E0C110|nr:hypothetical protein [Dyadobacter sp. LHD-138]MDQ6482234.1 hypothetical protein [Dyadobacter sp. LHD-138]
MSVKTNEILETLESLAPENPVQEIEIDSINLSFGFSYRDISDPINPKPGNFNENVNLNFSNEVELNRILTEKEYLQSVVPLIANQLIKGLNADTAKAKEFKIAVKAAVEAI